MSLTPKAELKTEQKLVAGQRQQQQLAILHMTLQEVSEMANEQIQSNPMLEMDEHVADESPFSALSWDHLSTQSARQSDFPGEDAAPRSVVATDYHAARRSAEHEANPLDYAAAPESLSDYLTLQLTTYPLSRVQRQICVHLIAMLDDQGFFRESLEDTARELGVDTFELTQMLYVIQSLDPPGVGARDLQECLILQLAAGNHFNGYTLRIVKEALPLLSRNRISAIAKLLDVDTLHAKRYCDEIRALSPIPARGYYTGERSNYIIPDAVIVRSGAHFSVQMNDSMIPHLVINSEYESLLETTADAELKDYLKPQLSAAKNLISDIAARQETLHRIICEIVKKQPRFFEDGKTLKPMLMEEIADAVGIHISTVSRAIAGKYIVCAAGTVSLRSLFTAGYAVGSNENAVSAAVIKRQLTELIAAEDPDAPLSDDALAQRFRSMGIQISRRTVAKYREEQGIPCSNLRRRHWE